jgi:hypothetical protein
MNVKSGVHRDVPGLNMSAVLGPFVATNRALDLTLGQARLRAVTLPALLPKGAKVEEAAWLRWCAVRT